MADRERAASFGQRLAAIRAELERLRFETDRRWDELLSRLAENPEETFSAEARSQPATGGLAPVRGAVSAESARRLDASADQVEALTRFLEECLRHASRAVLLVERHGRAQPWKSAGFDGAPAERGAAVLLPGSDALERVREGVPQRLDAGNDISRALGAADAREAILVPFVVGEKVSGAVYADAAPEERSKLDPDAIALLTFLAGLVVDRLAKRQLIPSPALRPAEASAPGPRELGGPLAPPDARESRDEARRFARLLASEIKLYNEDAIAEGRERGAFSARLRDDIDRGRRLYEERVPAEVRAGADYYLEELRGVLGDGRSEQAGIFAGPPPARE